MSSSTQQLQLSSKTKRGPSIRQLWTHLSHNRCISWSLNTVLAVTAIVLLLVAPLDVVQAAFCVQLVVSCITSAVFMWTKDSRNAFGMSLALSVGHFEFLVCLIWDCEPLLLVLKLTGISVLWFSTRIMRITGARLVHALEHNPKSRVRVTIVQLLIGAALVLVASLHLAYPELKAFSFAEMALWVCFLVDVLWHFGIWKKTMKRVFGGVKGSSKIISRQKANLNTIESVKKRQSMITVGVLFADILICAGSIVSNPALDFLLQEKSNECKQRNAVGSRRVSAIGFPLFFAMHIAFWLTIYSHVVKKRRDEKLRDTKEDRRQVLQGSYVNASLISSQS
jgi:hypothetical protein